LTEDVARNLDLKLFACLGLLALLLVDSEFSTECVLFSGILCRNTERFERISRRPGWSYRATEAYISALSVPRNATDCWRGLGYSDRDV
jgi:hypothetical protein